jgi:hypothetical protein
MSTRIYNGFRFKPRTLDGVYRLLAELRPVVQEKQRAAHLQFLASNAIGIIDRNSIGRGEKIEHPLSHVGNELRDRQKEIKTTGHRDPQVDFEFSISVMPHKSRVYGILHCDQREWTTWFTALPEIEDYSYWDNSDREDGISARQWTARKKTWDAILGRDGRPGNAGLEFSVLSAVGYPKPSEVLPFIDTIEARAWSLASDILVDRHVQDNGGVTASNVFELLHRATDWVKDNKPIREAKAAEIAALLPEVTETVLLGWEPK